MCSPHYFSLSRGAWHHMYTCGDDHPIFLPNPYDDALSWGDLFSTLNRRCRTPPSSVPHLSLRWSRTYSGEAAGAGRALRSGNNLDSGCHCSSWSSNLHQVLEEGEVSEVGRPNKGVDVIITLEFPYCSSSRNSSKIAAQNPCAEGSQRREAQNTLYEDTNLRYY